MSSPSSSPSSSSTVTPNGVEPTPPPAVSVSEESAQLQQLMSEEDNDGQLSLYYRTRFHLTFLYNYSMVHHLGYFTGLKWWTQIDSCVILGALPTPAIIRQLAGEQQVKATINLCNEFGGNQELYSELGVTEFRFKTADFATPTALAITEAVKILEERTRQGHQVYVHCKVSRILTSHSCCLQGLH